MRRKRVNVDALRQRVSILDVLNGLGYDGPVRGKNMRCPIHQGNNRHAFAVWTEHFHCFSCGAHGDVIDLARALLHCDFPTALGYVAGLAGFRTDAAVPELTRAAVQVRRRDQAAKDAAARTKARRLLRCADAYRELTKQARQVGAALRLTDDPAIWDALDVLYTKRDRVEAVEAAESR